MKGKRKKIVVWLIVTVIALVMLVPVMLPKKEVPVVLTTAVAEYGDIATKVTATGTVKPVDTVAVGCRVSGTIEHLYADNNSVVKKGQLLAVLDKSILQSTVDQANASLNEAKANLTYQKSNYSRQQQLYSAGAISKAEIDLATSTYNTALATVSNIQAQVTAAVRNLSFAEIYSPIDGIVLSRYVSVGQTVAANFSTPLLFSLAKDLSNMQVLANVDEADIGTVEKGQSTVFTVDAFLNDKFAGTVKDIYIQPTVTSNVVTYPTIIYAANEDKKLKPGMTATITIYTREIGNALLIPVKALKYTPDATLEKQYELVYSPQGKTSGDKKVTGGGIDTTSANTALVWVLQGRKLVQKRIATGVNDNAHIVVRGGLAAHDTVVTGAEVPTAGAHGAVSSPFMPKPPGKK